MLDLTAQGAWEDLHRLRSPAGEPSMAGGEPSSAVDAGAVIPATPYPTEDTWMIYRTSRPRWNT